MIASVLLNLKMHLNLAFRRFLNFFEVFWRSETVKDLQKQVTSNPECSERLEYEQKMLEIAKENPYKNNLKDIVINMKKNKWY